MSKKWDFGALQNLGDREKRTRNQQKKKKKSEQKTRGETQDSGLSRRKALSIVSNVVDWVKWMSSKKWLLDLAMKSFWVVFGRAVSVEWWNLITNWSGLKDNVRREIVNCEYRHLFDKLCCQGEERKGIMAWRGSGNKRFCLFFLNKSIVFFKHLLKWILRFSLVMAIKKMS